MKFCFPDLKELLSVMVNEGAVYDIGHPHHPNIPHHPSHHPFLYSMSRKHGDVLYKGGVTSANDLVTTGSHTGTHMDALGHIACNGLMYNSIEINGNQSKTSGLAVNGIDESKPFIKRSVLLDVATYKGREYLDAGYPITAEDLKGTMEQQGIQITKGDGVLIRTGWAKHIEDADKFISSYDGTPGLNVAGAQFLVDIGISITGSDTAAYEVTPTDSLPVHKLLLVDNGINIIEVLDLEEISKDKKYEFILICLPLRIVGGTASPIRPIAIC